jgi:hypothetical protein
MLGMLCRPYKEKNRNGRDYRAAELAWCLVNAVTVQLESSQKGLVRSRDTGVSPVSESFVCC